MRTVLRWGQSAYETEADLALERDGAVALGLAWRLERASTPANLDADVLVVTSGVRVTAEVLERFRGELVIATTSGFDHIDLDACRRRGVAVVRLPEARRDAVVEQALAQLVVLMRRLPALEQAARGGVWAREKLPELQPHGLRGSRIAVVGLGVIGRRIAEILGALGAEVLGVDPVGVPGHVRRCAIDEALRAADAVTLHCSLTESSRGLLSGERLSMLAPHAVVVNTARGEVLDVRAAVERVREARLAGLAADVFPVEPYPGLAAGAAVPGVVFTPHSAGYTVDLGRRVAQGVIGALTQWTRGEAQAHVVS